MLETTENCRSKLRAAIIDDEPAARRLTEKLLTERFSDSIEVVGEATNVAEGQKLMEAERPELVFLAIDMPDGTRFDFLEQWPAAGFQVIFITAFDRFAVRAFRCAAVDYLLKPLDPENFFLSVQRVLSARKTVDAARFEALRVAFSKKKIDRLMLPHLTGFTVMPLSELLRIESDGNYCSVISKKKPPFLVTRPLGKLEEMLPADEFMRVHQSHLLNLNEVEGFEGGENGFARLSDGSKIPISRRQRNAFVQAISMRCLGPMR